MELLKVEWLDSSVYAGDWLCMEEAERMPPKYVESIGWLLTEEDKVVKLVSDVCGDHFNREVIIPKGCIISRKELKEG